MNNGYYSALKSMIKPMLKVLIQKQYISQEGAKAIYGSMNRWGPNFIQRVPVNISKSNFQNALAKYIVNLHNTHFNNNDVFGFSGGGDAFSTFGGSSDIFGSSSDNDVFGSSGGGFSTEFTSAFDNGPDLDSRSDIFGNSTNSKKEQDDESESVEFKRHVPDWYKGDSLAMRKFQREGIILQETPIPATENEGSSIRFNLVLKRVFRSHSDMLTYVSDVFTHGSFLAQVTYDKVINIKGKPDTVNTFIETLNKHIASDKQPIPTMRAIINMFDDCSRGIYDGFSEVLVNLFNKWVRASAMFTSKNACSYNVKIGSLNGVSMMLSGPSDPRISKVVGDVSDYDAAISKVCAKVLNVLNTITVTNDSNDIAAAMSNTNSGVDGGKYVVFSERDDAAILDEVKEGNVAIKYRDTTCVSNIDYSTSYCIAKSLLSEGKGVQLTDDVITSNLDAMIIKFFNVDIPTEVIFEDGTIVGYGLSTDMKRIIRVEQRDDDE